MNKQTKAGVGSTGFKSKTFMNASSNQNGFDTSDYAETEAKLQSDLLAVIKSSPKIVRLYRCFGCGRNYSLKKMSSCLIVCRGCRTATQGKGETAKTNFTRKVLNSVQGFLLRQLV
jgi:ribosomal protein L37AE/L43A